MKKKTELTSELKYNLLKEITLRMRDTFDLDKILNQILISINELIDYDAAGIFILNEENLIKTSLSSKQLIAGIARIGYINISVDCDEMLMYGRGLVGKVIKTGESIIVEDVRKNEDYFEARLETLSEIVVPIYKDGKTIGALNLESDTVANYNVKDLKILNFFAEITSISIEKAMLHNYLLRNKIIDNQLRVAKEIQQRLFPDKAPITKNYDISGKCISTFGIGGDYYDYIPLPNNKLAIVAADISGHGIPAALIMTAFRALLRSQANLAQTTSDLMELLNSHISEFTRKRDFITAFYAVLDFNNNTLKYTNAGHNPPILIKSDLTYIKLDQRGPTLNILKKVNYRSININFEAGDLLVIYTDGVVEAFNKRMEEFGLERLIELVQDNYNKKTNLILDLIENRIKNFRGISSFEDDFTLVLVKRES